MAKGNGSASGNGAGSGPVISFADLKGEIARLAVWRQDKPDAEFELELIRVAKQTGMGLRKLRRWIDTEIDPQGEQSDKQPLPATADEASGRVDQLKPDLVIQPGNLPAAVYAIRDEFKKTGEFYERGVPVRVVASKRGRLPQIVPLTVENVVIKVHERFRPVVPKWRGGRRRMEPVDLPDRAARQYLALRGEWDLPALEGISTAPLLTDDGGIRTAEGYDPASGLWCSKVPPVSVPERPSLAEAKEALYTLRRAFRTFAFADAPRRVEMMTGANGQTLEVEVVDLEQPPGRDESTLLAAVQGAVCRPSLHLAPAVMVNAAQLSGSGSGKGLLLCGISLIGFGVLPWRFTKGGSKRNPEELEKRLSAALLDAHPCLLLENVNSAVLQSETLESV
ncbi:MAG: hypothetical protein WA633_00450, partial [Stellaceae bacterium]